MERYTMEPEQHDGCGELTGYMDEITDPAGEWVKFEDVKEYAEMKKVFKEVADLLDLDPRMVISSTSAYHRIFRRLGGQQ